MKTLQKAAWSLVISFLVSGVFYALSFAGIYNFDLFEIIEDGFTEARIILLVSLFLTLYLLVFLFFNLRQDSVTVIQSRMKRLLISLLEQFYEQKISLDWRRWSRELESRKDEIRKELKMGLKTEPDTEKIDFLIDRTWDEMISVSEKSVKEIVKNDYREDYWEYEDSGVTEEDDIIEELEELTLAVDAPLHAGLPHNLPDKIPEDVSELEEIPGTNHISNPNSGLFVTDVQYFAITGNNKIESLEVIHGDDDESLSVIEEREGVHYVSKYALDSIPEAPGDLNREFKELVDSILKS